jgi:hypothetical protein
VSAPILPILITACMLASVALAAKTRPTLFAFTLLAFVVIGYSWTLELSRH